MLSKVLNFTPARNNNNHIRFCQNFPAPAEKIWDFHKTNLFWHQLVMHGNKVCREASRALLLYNKQVKFWQFKNFPGCHQYITTSTSTSTTSRIKNMTRTHSKFNWDCEDGLRDLVMFWFAKWERAEASVIYFSDLSEIVQVGCQKQ